MSAPTAKDPKECNSVPKLMLACFVPNKTQKTTNQVKLNKTLNQINGLHGGIELDVFPETSTERIDRLCDGRDFLGLASCYKG